MIVPSKFQLPYIWSKWLPSGIGHIIDQLNIELLLYIHAYGCVKGTLSGHCSVECVDGHIILLPKGFKVFPVMQWLGKAP